MGKSHSDVLKQMKRTDNPNPLKTPPPDSPQMFSEVLIEPEPLVE
jgi:hypothetical protein